MLFRLPKHTPPRSVMLEDLGHPKAGDLAKVLGVHKRTVYYWIRKDDAPLPVLLALFWVTRWGLQWSDAEVYNLAMLHMGMTAALTRENEAMRAELAGRVPTPAPDEEMAPPGRHLLYVVR